jgi:hypothetical protein
MVATPCYGGLVTQRYMQSICALMQYGNVHGLSVGVELLGYDSLIPRARNTLMAAFLDQPAATHLMFIDADIGFHPDQVARMLAFDQEVVAGMYPLKIINYDLAALDRARGGEPLETAQLRYVGALEEGEALVQNDGFATAVYAGTGFMLIRRSALERLMKAYPEMRYTAAHNHARPSLSPNQYALFDCLIHPETREYLSEDYAFCHRWRAIGGQLWLDTQSQLTHIGPREFQGDAGLRYPANGTSTPLGHLVSSTPGS